MNRSTLLLVLTLVILGGVVFFLIPSGNERESSDKGPEVSLSIDSSAVTKLSIEHPPRFLSVENIGGKWTIVSPIHYQADPTSVGQVLSALSKFKIGSLISSNPQKQSLFQVDSAGTRLSITERSGKSTTLVIGKTGPSFSEVYFRLDGSNDVYLCEGLDSWTINKEVKDWRDRTIVAVPNESLTGISFTMNGRRAELYRDSAVWRSGKRILRSDVMTPFLNTVRNFRADDFVDSVVKFSESPASIVLHGADNISLSLHPSSQDSSKYFVQTSSSSQVFVVNKSVAQQLLKPARFNASLSPASFVSAKKGSTDTVAAPKPALEMHEIAPATSASEPEPKKSNAKKNRPALPPANLESKQEVTQPLVMTKKDSLPETQKKSQPTSGKKAESIPAQSKKTADSTPSTSPTVSPIPTAGDDEGDLTVYTVKKNETMELIARRYRVTVEQVLKWNLLKSIVVTPGQELYIYVRK